MELADIFKKYLKTFLKNHAQQVYFRHKRVISHIVACRTPKLGGHKWYCKSCDKYHYSYKSCGDRHCPKCQNEKTAEWFEKMKKFLLPCPYFMATFTIPQELRIIFLKHQKTMYRILFRASSQALMKLASDPRFIGSRIGLLGVLQTWAKALIYHPHIHYLVTAGGLSYDTIRWIYGKQDFLVHVTPLSRLFKGIFKDLMKKESQLFRLVPQQVWQKDWGVHLEPVGSGENVLKYLARYIFRVAISNRHILGMHDDRVVFRYKNNETGKYETEKLHVFEFIRRYLNHILPKGFIKVRHYGLFASQNKELLCKAKELLHMRLLLNEKSDEKNDPKEPRCPDCGQPMIFVEVILPQREPPFC